MPVDGQVAIVMATYEGVAYVEEQIRSLQAQDFGAWTLYVRDDGSSDGTAERVAALARSDARIALLERGGRLGVTRNFGALLSHAHLAGAAYVFLCDQDDVWMPGKVSASLAAMRRLEGLHGAGTPTLVHSDLEVVDSKLRSVHPSFLRYQGIHHEGRDPLAVLLVQNFVTGCASVVNRALLDLALPIPEESLMHDWWLALCAAAGGNLGFLPEPSLRYRQHAANQVGAGGAFGNLNPFTTRGRRQLRRSWSAVHETLAQARALAARFRDRGAPALHLDVVERYARLAELSPARRLRALRELGIRRHTAFFTALLYARVACIGLAASPRTTPPRRRGTGRPGA